MNSKLILDAILAGHNTNGKLQKKFGRTRRQVETELKRLKHLGRVAFSWSTKRWFVTNPYLRSSQTVLTKTPHTRYIYLVDVSGSMCGYERDMERLIQDQVNELRSVQGQRIDYDVCAFDTNNYRQLRFKHTENQTQVFNAWGMTPLYDAVFRVKEQVSKHTDEAVVLNIFTDGADNASRRSRAETVDLIRRLTNAGKWTFAYFCPPGNESYITKAFGIARTNVHAWDRTKKGIERVSHVSVASTRAMTNARSKGVTQKKTGYIITDLSDLTRETLQDNLVDMRCRFKVTTVQKETDIKSFIETKTGMPLLPGTTFFELTKPEKVSSQKELLIMEKGTKAIYGGNQARELLGLPTSGAWKDVKVKPGNHANYHVFIQSTSQNRKLVRGTKVVYIP